MNIGIVFYFLGWVLGIEGILMILPCVVALVYREPSGFYFLGVALFCGISGWLLAHRKLKSTVFYAKEGFVAVSLSWIVLSFFGALPFFLSGEIPLLEDALFEVISGFTTTGASVLPDVEALSRCMLMWRSFTHWIGGMGVLVFILAVLPLAGGYNIHIMRAESPGPSVGKLVPRVRTTAKILYLIYLFITVVQIILLLFTGMPLFDSMAMSFGTVYDAQSSLLFVYLAKTDRARKHLAFVLRIYRNKLPRLCSLRNLICLDPHAADIVCQSFLADHLCRKLYLFLLNRFHTLSSLFSVLSAPLQYAVDISYHVDDSLSGCLCEMLCTKLCVLLLAVCRNDTAGRVYDCAESVLIEAVL